MTSALRSVILGAGGHARVVLDAMRSRGLVLPECALDSGMAGASIDGIPVEGGDELLPQLAAKGITHFILGIGGLGSSPLRPQIWEKAVGAGLAPLGVFHAEALVAESASVGAGAQVLARAVVNAGACIGKGSIVNTSAVVEHDCRVGDFCHLAPMSCLGGGVSVGDSSHIGLGAVVREYRKIGSSTIVGTGAAVICDLPDMCTAVGVPAKPVVS